MVCWKKNWFLFVSVFLPLAFTMIFFFVTDAAAQTPRRGGILKILSASGDATYLGYPPKSRKLLDYQYVSPCIETLIKFDNNLLPAPNLASSWKIADDKRSITFSLRKGVKFHDGSDFNAEAVKYNIKLCEKHPSFSDVIGVDVLDDYTVLIKFKNITGSLWSYFSISPGEIQSPAALEKNGREWTKLNPVGTGPFLFKSFVRDVSLEYVKNPNYWQKGKPYLDGV